MDEHNENLGQDSDQPNKVLAVLEAVGGVLGAVPASVYRNAAKSFSHLMAVPVAHLQGKAAEVRSIYDARVQVNKALGKALAKKAAEGVTAIEIESAFQAQATKILRQRQNVNNVVKQAAVELTSLPADAQAQPVDEISEDWLNAFESEAVNMSSEHMQRLFAKMLAGEIRRPSSFSIKTVKLMSQLDNDVAVTFRRFCSYVVSFGDPSNPSDVAHTPAFKSSSGPAVWMPPEELVLLFEYGLLRDTKVTQFRLDRAIVGTSNAVLIPFTYLGHRYILTPIPPKSGPEFDGEIHLGVGLSRAGNEILRIVAPDEDANFTETLANLYKMQGLRMDRFDGTSDLDSMGTQ